MFLQNWKEEGGEKEGAGGGRDLGSRSRGRGERLLCVWLESGKTCILADQRRNVLNHRLFSPATPCDSTHNGYCSNVGFRAPSRSVLRMSLGLVTDGEAGSPRAQGRDDLKYYY